MVIFAGEGLADVIQECFQNISRLFPGFHAPVMKENTFDFLFAENILNLFRHRKWYMVSSTKLW